MRLLYISYSKIPSRFANSIQVMRMCHAFAQYGWSVTLFCLCGTEKTNVNSYYGLPNSSVRLVPIRMPRVKVISRFLYGVRVLWMIKQSRWHGIIYGRDFYSLALIVKTKLIQQPIYLEVHQPPSNGLEDYLQKLIFRSPYFKGLVTISSSLQKEYQRRYGKLLAGRVSVAHDAATPLENISAYLPASKVPRIGYTGSLQPGKGVELIVEIAKLLPNIEFHVVGGNKEQVSYWRTQCPASVLFHGYQHPRKIASYIASFDVVLAPYLPHVKVGQKKVDIARWMSPLKLFEYMSADKPIIASNLPVLREVLHHEQNAILVNSTSPIDWKEAIQRLLKDDTLCQRLGQRAQQDFYEKYTWEKRAEQISKLFSVSSTQTAPVS